MNNFFLIRFGRYLAYEFRIDWLKKPLVFTYGLSAYFYISWAIPLAFLIELLLDLWRKWFNLGKLDDNLLFFILFSSRLKFTIIVSVYTYSKYIIFSLVDNITKHRGGSDYIKDVIKCNAGSIHKKREHVWSYDAWAVKGMRLPPGGCSSNPTHIKPFYLKIF